MLYNSTAVSHGCSLLFAFSYQETFKNQILGVNDFPSLILWSILDISMGQKPWRSGCILTSRKAHEYCHILGHNWSFCSGSHMDRNEDQQDHKVGQHCFCLPYFALLSLLASFSKRQCVWENPRNGKERPTSGKRKPTHSTLVARSLRHLWLIMFPMKGKEMGITGKRDIAMVG